MKRFLGVLAALLLVTVLASVVLAFTTLRPRTEVLPPTFGVERYGNLSFRSRIQVTRSWGRSLATEWGFGSTGVSLYSPHRQMLFTGWHYGPFAFVEERDIDMWPVAVEKAARAMAVQKLGVKEPTLDIQRDYKSLRWHVIASAPGRERLEMNFELIRDDYKKPRLVRR